MRPLRPTLAGANQTVSMQSSSRLSVTPSHVEVALSSWAYSSCTSKALSANSTGLLPSTVRVTSIGFDDVPTKVENGIMQPAM